MNSTNFALTSEGHNRYAGTTALYERAKRVMPGGNARTSVFQRPHPIYLSHGAGARVWDVDGNEYIDFRNNFTALIHGHSYPPVVERVKQQTELGLSFSAPTESEIELAELLCSRVPYFEHIRFVNSGTEAVMNTVKAARAFTGRAKIAKCEGAYHGSYDHVEVSLEAGPDDWGDETAPNPVPYCEATPGSLVNDTVVIPFNDLDNTRDILSAHTAELAAVLIDPLPSKIGLLPVDPSYLKFLREFTAANGILLISDEVLSFRLSYQGGMGRFGIQPDLCAFGKIMGGGLPVGAIGGPAPFMSVFDPTGDRPPVPQAGTFSANPMSMVAGTAAMQGMTVEAFKSLEELGDYARNSLREALARENLPTAITGTASLFHLHLLDEGPTNYRQARLSPERGTTLSRLARYAQENGLLMAHSGLFSLSTPMTPRDVDEMIEIVCTGLRSLRRTQ